MLDIYHSASRDTKRFTLGRGGERILFAFGLHPLLADRERADPTLPRVDKVARMHGFDGFCMLNLYPVRAAGYRMLPAEADAEAFDENLARIEQDVAYLQRLYGSTEGPTLWAAWGQAVVGRDYFLKARAELYRRLSALQPRWVRHGDPMAGGHPRHASQVRYANRLQAFDIAPA